MSKCCAENRFNKEYAMFKFLSLIVKWSIKKNNHKLKKIFDNYKKYAKLRLQKATSHISPPHVEGAAVDSLLPTIDDDTNSSHQHPNINIRKINHVRRTSIELTFIRNSLLSSDPQFSVFKKMKPDELDTLCSTVKYKFYNTRSIIFLQGEVGDTTYIIVSGSVNLYFEANRVRENEVLSAYNKGVTYDKLVHDSDLNSFGVFVRQLPSGSIFGDIPVLSDAVMTRSATAVADGHSLVFMVPVHCYMNVLRQYRGQHIRVTNAIEVLGDLPAFKEYSHPKLASIAFELKYQTFPRQVEIAIAGTPIQFIYVIQTGSVSVCSSYSREDRAGAMNVSTHSIGTLTKGMMIGDHEVRHKLKHYQLTYVTSHETEVFAMDAAAYTVHAFSHQLRREREGIYQFAELLEAKPASNESHTRMKALYSSIFSLPGLVRTVSPGKPVHQQPKTSFSLSELDMGSTDPLAISIAVDCALSPGPQNSPSAYSSRPNTAGAFSPRPSTADVRLPRPEIPGHLQMRPNTPGAITSSKSTPTQQDHGSPAIKLLFSERYSSDSRSKHLRSLHAKNNLFKAIFKLFQQGQSRLDIQLCREGCSDRVRH